MRLGIDLQALQTEGSRHRGIGRYVGALLAALLASYPEHEYVFFGSERLPTAELDISGHQVTLLPLDLQHPAQAEAPARLSGRARPYPHFTSSPSLLLRLAMI
jgi:hypothetical protein